VIEAELGVPWGAVFSSLSASPVAAASLGQVYKGTLASNGAEVAVKVRVVALLVLVLLVGWCCLPCSRTCLEGGWKESKENHKMSIVRVLVMGRGPAGTGLWWCKQGIGLKGVSWH
jgi:hypothetical protein